MRAHSHAAKRLIATLICYTIVFASRNPDDRLTPATTINIQHPPTHGHAARALKVTPNGDYGVRPFHPVGRTIWGGARELFFHYMHSSQASCGVSDGVVSDGERHGESLMSYGKPEHAHQPPPLRDMQEFCYCICALWAQMQSNKNSPLLSSTDPKAIIPQSHPTSDKMQFCSRYSLRHSSTSKNSAATPTPYA